jgi:hypothetical protein
MCNETSTYIAAAFNFFRSKSWWSRNTYVLMGCDDCVALKAHALRD